MTGEALAQGGDHDILSFNTTMTLGYRSTRAGAIADVGRAIAMATGGVAVFAPIEYALTAWAYAGPVEHPLSLAALVATLALWLWFVLAVGLAIVLVAVRLVRGAFDREAARGPGWFAPSPPIGGVRPGVPRLWAALATIGAVGFVVQRAAAYIVTHYKEPQLTAVVLAAVAIAGVGLAIVLRRPARLAAALAAAALAPTLGRANPFGRWRAAAGALTGAGVGVLVAFWFAVPQSHSVLPTRIIISIAAIAYGMGQGALWHVRPRRRKRSRRVAVAVAGAMLVLQVATFLWLGADPQTKYVAITASPALDRLVALVRVANDLDGDGFGSLLGENDCAPLDPSIHPGAIDIPDDGIDQNCDGHDYSLKTPLAPTGPTLPVPPQFKKPWNVLFITIDTLRYDHTTFGGYKRNTTPRLAELVKQSTSFTFCNAPSAGTMWSIPAIITSKFFSYGLAVDENRPPGTPPKLQPENTLLSEVMKRGGYTTGVVASHEWWNDWGMDQGVDDYDNSIGKTADPYRAPADKVTDHALAWISRQQGKKWFMWAHYIDPHGYYVNHPDVADYGPTQMDWYDSEIAWTDQQIGRLLDELKHLPSYGNTIIVITSDHGDSMAEHEVPLGTHGTALYRELQNVPMIFFVPDNAPHLIRGAVSNLDIVPTIAELAGIDTSDLHFEGRSEVPAIFYGKEDRARVVFAETDAPTPQRAAISEQWKLIYYLQSNVYQLYDLTKDPWEHDNLASKRPPAFETMKQALDGWLERAAYERLRDVLLPATPTPEVATTGQSIDGDKIEITGIGLADGARLAPGARVAIHVYFEVHERTDVPYKFLLAAWPINRATWKPTDPAPLANMARSTMRSTADGLFPADKWQPGQHVRERFSLTIPGGWQGDAVAIGLVAADAHGSKPPAAGPAPSNEADLAVLGVLPLAGSSARPAP
jgi:arylsulfatase A-like enzyme